MNNITKLATTPVITLAIALAATSGSAQAQSSEGVAGAIIGGTVGTVVGGKIDNRGSSSDGKVIGALVGGSLGYIIGDGLGNDDQLITRHSSKSGSYYRHNGKSYRRYADHQYGYVYIPIKSNDPYYYSDGRRRQASYYKSRSHRKLRH